MESDKDLRQESAGMHRIGSTDLNTDGSRMSGKRPLLVCGCGTSLNHLLPAIRNAGWHVEIADKVSSAHSLVSHNSFLVGLVLFDHRCDSSTLAEIERVISCSSAMSWIALQSSACVDSVEISRLITRYCYDFHTPPFDEKKLLGTIGHAYGMQRLQLSAAMREDVRGLQGLIGCSEPMRKLYQKIRKAAGVDATVLLGGESGSGKELTARAIHDLSVRAGQPFVSVNCAALPATLIQSELFGHEKGSFTGACKRHVGYLEIAGNGTLFLDEIGELPIDMQINLLRFLEDKIVTRIGSTEKLHINARIIAATNKDIGAEIEAGRFRRDLFFRLSVLNIQVPSLIEHADDIEQIAEHVYQQNIHEKRPGLHGFSKQALHAMRRYHWPGNVRELANRVRHAMVMSEGRLISPADLGLTDEMPGHPTLTLETTLKRSARNAIETALKNTCNNISQAARDLDVSRTTLYRLMNKFSIET